MVTHKRLTLTFVLGFLLLCILGSHSVSGSAEGEVEIIETFFAGGRHLLQDVTQCPHQWNADNFTVLEENCPYLTNVTITYDKKRCCEYGLGAMLCPYQALISDSTNNCITSFWVTLSLVAPNYTNDWFGFICTDPNSPQGILCPANLTANSNDSNSSGNFSSRSHSFGFSLLLAVALFEILVLLF